MRAGGRTPTLQESSQASDKFLIFKQLLYFDMHSVAPVVSRVGGVVDGLLLSWPSAEDRRHAQQVLQRKNGPHCW